MGVKRQQGGADQRDLLDEALKAALRHCLPRRRPGRTPGAQLGKAEPDLMRTRSGKRLRHGLSLSSTLSKNARDQRLTRL
jgi:hypothetical protein